MYHIYIICGIQRERRRRTRGGLHVTLPDFALYPSFTRRTSLLLLLPDGLDFSPTYLLLLSVCATYNTIHTIWSTTLLYEERPGRRVQTLLQEHYEERRSGQTRQADICGVFGVRVFCFVVELSLDLFVGLWGKTRCRLRYVKHYTKRVMMKINTPLVHNNNTTFGRSDTRQRAVVVVVLVGTPTSCTTRRADNNVPGALQQTKHVCVVVGTSLSVVIYHYACSW